MAQTQASPSRQQLRGTAILAGGAVSALCVLWLLRGLPLGGAAMWLSPLPLMAVALAFGVRDAALAVLVAALPLLALAGWPFMASHVLSVGLPVLLACGLAFAVPPGSAPRLGPSVVALALLGALLFLAAGLAFMNQPGGLHGALTAQFREALTQSAMGRPGGTPMETMVPQLADLVARVLPIALGFWYLGAMALNAALAQRLVNRFGLLARPPVLFAALELPRWYWKLPIVAAVVALLLPEDARYVAWGVTEILALPFLMLGLAVVHVMARRTASPKLWLIAFYLAFLLLPPSMPVIVGLGFAERWANLRGRMLARANSGTKTPPEDRT